MTPSIPAPAETGLPAQRALVLGSTSRYRQELLQRLRIPFTVAAPDVDETPQPGEAPAALAQRLALLARRLAWLAGSHRPGC